MLTKRHLCERHNGLYREGEAPAELATPKFGRSLTLPSNGLVGQNRWQHVNRGGLTLIFNEVMPVYISEGAQVNVIWQTPYEIETYSLTATDAVARICPSKIPGMRGGLLGAAPGTETSLRSRQFPPLNSQRA